MAMVRTGEVVLVFTGSEDPMWPFLLEGCSSSQRARLVLFATDQPQRVQCSYSPLHRKVTFIIDGEEISGEKIKGVWWRRLVPPPLGRFNKALQEYCVGEYRAFFEWFEDILLDKVQWVSRPSMIARANNKANQLRCAYSLGFRTLETIFTNSPLLAGKFVADIPTVYKSISTPRVPLSEDVHSTVFTTLLTMKSLKRLDGLVTCPAILQRFCQKVGDVRVTVFGDAVFAVLIESQGNERTRVDFRTEGRNLPHHVHQLPLAEEERCRKLVAMMGLAFGAIDLALHDDGTYTFFEINPNGQWGWLEEKTGLPMRHALLNLLFG